MKYRKKPVVVEAVQWTRNDHEMQDFLGANLQLWPQYPNILDLITKDALNVRGTCCRINDWVVKGSGVEHVVRQEAFKAEYEPIP